MITPAVISPAELAGPYGAGNAGTYEDKIRAGCAEFERILLRQMLREVRAGSLVQSSSESQSYMELADDRMADFMTQAGGLGLGKAMADQFLGQIRAAKSLDNASNR
jgi:Rod binding domain-containing protein